MKKIINFLFAGILLFTLGCGMKLSTPHPSELIFSPIKFTPPEAEKTTLDSGATLYLMEDDELPLFHLSIMLKTGSVYEPADKVGLAELTGRVMRTGGTQFMTADEINEELEFIAGSVETSIGQDAGYASLSVMKKDLDRGLKLLGDVLMTPVFEQGKFELEKKKMLEAIRRQNDNPKRIAGREFYKIVYKDHPYGREKTLETINNINRQDLIDFYKKYFRPNNMMIGVTGDFNRNEVIKKLNNLFKDWSSEEIEFEKVPPLKKRFSNTVYYVEKDINQSVIKVGHLGIKYDNPDLYALRLMNYILGGGGFQSRLMKEIRSEKGLAYSIWSSFGAGHREPGVFIVSGETKASSTHEVIQAIIQNIERIRREGVSDEELKTAKDYIINSFIFKFTRDAQIVSQQMLIDYFNMPKDYLLVYRDKIRDVTKEDIQRVAKKYLKPDKLYYLVVGNKDKFDKPLSQFGKVESIELTK